MDKLDAEEKMKIATMHKEKRDPVAGIGWMYKDNKPDSEEYLLGKRIDKHVEGEHDKKEDEASVIFGERIKANIALDVAAKMREDPLFAIRRREEESRKKLLENPIKMKELQKLIDEQQKQKAKKEKKSKKKKKKKHKSKQASSSGDSDEDDDIMKKYLSILTSKQEGEGKRKEKKTIDKSWRGEDSQESSEEEGNKHKKNSQTNTHKNQKISTGLVDKRGKEKFRKGENKSKRSRSLDRIDQHRNREQLTGSRTQSSAETDRVDRKNRADLGSDKNRISYDRKNKRGSSSEKESVDRDGKIRKDFRSDKDTVSNYKKSRKDSSSKKEKSVGDRKNLKDFPTDKYSVSNNRKSRRDSVNEDRDSRRIRDKANYNVIESERQQSSIRIKRIKTKSGSKSEDSEDEVNAKSNNKNRNYAQKEVRGKKDQSQKSSSRKRRHSSSDKDRKVKQTRKSDVRRRKGSTSSEGEHDRKESRNKTRQRSSSSSSSSSAVEKASSHNPSITTGRQYGLIISVSTQSTKPRQPSSPPSILRSPAKPKSVRLPTPPRGKLTAEEKKKKLAEMMENAEWREEQRVGNVKRYREEEQERERKDMERQGGSGFLSSMMVDHASTSSVEDRIRRNKYNIQRTKVDLDKNFTKK